MRRSRHLQRRSRRGFTLVELMVALVMGLIISLAAVGLARTATTTFYEQARVSAVEGSIRSASERLRSDLSRASFMSTPNIQWDTKLAKTPSAANAAYRIAALMDLQGIRVAKAADEIRNHALESKNSLTPHEVYISGNLTTDDSYRGQLVAIGGGDGCGGTIVRLGADADPAVRRLLNGATTSADRVSMAQVAFMPGLKMSPAQTGFDYAVQVMDMRGCYHYATACEIVDASSHVPNSIDIKLKGGVLTTSDTGGDVCGGRLMEEVAIAPVQRVRWSLKLEDDARRIDTTLEGTGANKINLTRQLLAADGATEIGRPEIVAEYAVDLKLGLMVDSSTDGNPVAFTNIDFEAGDGLFADWAGLASASTQAKGPHHIRTVRYRLAFRTPYADRKANLTLSTGAPYLLRYCMADDGTNCTDYARVRTVISEVALLNQAKAY